MPHFPEILLVEDSKDDRDLFQLATLRSGIQASLTYAVDAPDAFYRLSHMGKYQDRRLPDLIVLDLGLPGLKGSTLLDVIRHSTVSKRIAVVVWTGSERESDRARCEAIGIQEFFIKPQTFASLVSFVGALPRFFPTPAALDPKRAGYKTPLPEQSFSN